MFSIMESLGINKGKEEELNALLAEYESIFFTMYMQDSFFLLEKAAKQEFESFVKIHYNGNGEYIDKAVDSAMETVKKKAELYFKTEYPNLKYSIDKNGMIQIDRFNEYELLVTEETIPIDTLIHIFRSNILGNTPLNANEIINLYEDFTLNAVLRGYEKKQLVFFAKDNISQEEYTKYYKVYRDGGDFCYKTVCGTVIIGPRIFESYNDSCR